MVDLNPDILIITLNERKVNILIKRQRLSLDEKKKIYNSAYKTYNLNMSKHWVKIKRMNYIQYKFFIGKMQRNWNFYTLLMGK